MITRVLNLHINISTCSLKFYPHNGRSVILECLGTNILVGPYSLIFSRELFHLLNVDILITFTYANIELF